MRTAPIPFAGSQLGEVRHVCAFFNSDDEEYRVLLPFMPVLYRLAVRGHWNRERRPVRFAHFEKHCPYPFRPRQIQQLSKQARTQSTPPGWTGNRHVFDFPFLAHNSCDHESLNL